MPGTEWTRASSCFVCFQGFFLLTCKGSWSLPCSVKESTDRRLSSDSSWCYNLCGRGSVLDDHNPGSIYHSIKARSCQEGKLQIVYCFAIIHFSIGWVQIQACHCLCGRASVTCMTCSKPSVQWLGLSTRLQVHLRSKLDCLVCATFLNLLRATEIRNDRSNLAQPMSTARLF